MNRIFVLKDVAYASKVGGGVIASAKEVNVLSKGALAFFTDRGLLLTPANAAATLPDVKEVMIAVGREADTQVITIPRRIVNINRANYRAFVKPVFTVGPLSILAGAVGEAFIKVSDISFTSRYSPRLVNASVYKKAGDTIESVVDALVAKLNGVGSFVTASKVNLDGAYEVSTIVVTAAATAAGTATVSLNGVSVNLPLTADTIAVNTNEIAAAIDALEDYTAVSDGINKVTITAVAAGVQTDIATYAAGTATTSAATLAVVTQGVDSTNTLFSIVITPKEDEVAIEINMGGLIENNDKVLSTAPVYGIGRGIDALQMEKDFSTEEGNGNYTEYTAEWYSRVMEAVASSNYDMITLLWEGVHSSPTVSKNVMKNRVIIATVNGISGGNGQSAASIMTLLALIFSTAYTSTTGTETVTDSGTAYDGIAGN